MDFETARRAIDAFRGYPLKIQFAGGEPLLNFPLAEKICRYAENQGLDAVFSLQTNGTLLTEDLVSRLQENRISVGVSLDGIPEINERTRGKTLEAVRGIRLLGDRGVTLGINAVVTAETVEALPKLADFALYLGNVGGIGLDLLRHAGRGQQQKAAEPEQLRQAVTALENRCLELKGRLGVRIRLREVELAKKRLSGLGDPRYYCYASCGRSAVVLPDGKTYPCDSLICDDYFMGRAEDLDPEKLRRLPGQPASHCASCPYGRVCPGGCPSRRIRNQNDLECVLLKTAFSLAERELYDHRDQSDGYQPGSGPFYLPGGPETVL